MKSTLLLLLLTIASLLLPSELMAGQWKAYTYADAYSRVFRVGQHLYITKGNSIFRADAETWQIEFELNHEHGLSGNEIVDVCYSEACQQLVIVYTNGIIDLLHEDGSIWTIPDLCNAPMPAIDKTIHSIRVQDGLLFLHTAYGFAVVDIELNVILENFLLGVPVRSAWLLGKEWFYSTKKGTYSCPRYGSNPHLPSSWTYRSGHVIEKVEVFSENGVEQCWQMAQDKTLRKILSGHHSSQRCFSGGDITTLQRVSHYIMASVGDSLVLYDTRMGPPVVNEEELQPGQRIACRQTSPYANGRAIACCPLDSEGHRLAFLYPDRGLMADSIHIVSPRRFQAVSLGLTALTTPSYQNNGLYNRIVNDGQGEVCMSYTPDLSLSYSKILAIQGSYSTVQTATGTWKNYDSSSVTDYLSSNKRFCGITELVADPIHPSRYYFGSLEDGIICVDHGKLYKRYDATTTNHGIDACSPGCNRVGGIAFDGEGNLWCHNEGLTNGLRVMRQADGKWFSFKIPGLEKEYGFTHLCATRRNGRHQVWGYQQMLYERTNVFCYDYGTDIANTQDDRCTFFKTLLPDHPGAVPFVPYYGRNIYEGPTGAIWLFNTSGLYIIDDPDAVFDNPGSVRQVLALSVPTTMAIDSQDHVWVGTENDGLLLFSADGTQQLAQFTSTNSILRTNEILSLTYEPTQSTLWIVTKDQVLTYTYDAGEYSPEGEWTSVAYCYPARVQRQARATVNVYGLQPGTEASIYNSQGRLLCQETALGGIISIDTHTYPVGTYSVMGIDSEGNRGELLTFEVEPKPRESIDEEEPIDEEPIDEEP